MSICLGGERKPGVEKKQMKTNRQHEPHADQQVGPAASKRQPKPVVQEAWNGGVLEAWSDQQESEDGGVSDADVASSQPATSKHFSLLLGFLLKNDRSEIVRLARGVGVSDNTVYRWLKGISVPRYTHIQRILEVLGQVSLTSPAPINQSTYQNRHANDLGGRWDVPRELYRRVLEQAATSIDDASRRWHIIETIFEQALLFFDPERLGIALTYAKLMPPHEDGMIHSLYEAEMRGQAPWPFALEFKTYLGSTTLAGFAVMSQRVRVWSKSDTEARIPVGIDEHELSSCTAPVMRGGRLAGALIVSSAREDFVNNPAIPRAVGDYANLLAAGLMDSDFYAIDVVRLVPMPDLPWQRDKISRSYLNRVIDCARKQCLSFPEAERKVLRDLEVEFELHAAQHNEQIARQEMVRQEAE